MTLLPPASQCSALLPQGPSETVWFTLSEYEESYKSYLSSDDVHANDEEEEDG